MSGDGINGIASIARESGSKIALVDDRGQTTYQELESRQRAVAGLLREAGLGEGDKIAVLATNRREYLEVTIGALRAGIVPVPVNPLLQPPEVAYVLEDSGAKWLFTDRAGAPPGVERTVVFGTEYERLQRSAPRAANLAGYMRTRPMHYTSGTTGRSKGVFVQVADTAEAGRRSERFRTLWGINERDVHLVCSPLGHSAPHRFAARTLEAGGTVVLADRFDATEVLARIERDRVTSTFVVPTHLQRILKLEPAARGRYDLSSMRLLAHAGAPIAERTKLDTLRLFPASSVWEFYGSTEGPTTRISAPEWLRKRGSVGRAIPGAEIWVRNESFEALPPGEVGQIWVKDEDVERFVYWNDDDKTTAAWRDGAFTVGDLGWLDDDGYLYLTGRMHDTIVTGGVNVYPQEVELVLGDHPDVVEAVIFGVPHEEWGQEVVGRVVLTEVNAIDPDEILAWLRSRIAHYKCPRRLEVVASIPRSPTGKIVRPRF